MFLFVLGGSLSTLKSIIHALRGNNSVILVTVSLFVIFVLKILKIDIKKGYKRRCRPCLACVETQRKSKGF
jgi:hypothetical protein